MIDAVQENTYVLMAANSGKGAKPKPPKPVPRPDSRARGQNTNPFAAQAKDRLRRIAEAKRRKAISDGEGARD
jgi:hypothetical protein